ncbi:hypothetical protein EST38_g766 [Candolleomyces aberdarensis]|uniref:MYND-type domain-containing protein n=1 Tax=Candolleomyces aberdarensis TaxID=2316362 RepID=A0A4Q2DZA4_9AGAR|nr:hypothetical protein EST38_g766 [Candolleomyces aberdarensis]
MQALSHVKMRGKVEKPEAGMLRLIWAKSSAKFGGRLAQKRNKDGVLPELRDKFIPIFLQYTPKVLRWCLFFSKATDRLTASREYTPGGSINRPVHKFTNLVTALLSTTIDSSPLIDAITSSQDAAETLIHLWNVAEPDSGEPLFYVSGGLDGVSEIINQLPSFIVKGRGEDTMVATLDRITSSTLKRMVKNLERRIRALETTDPRSAYTVYMKLEVLVLTLRRNLKFYYALDRYVDWRCFTTAIVQIFKDPNAFPDTSTMVEPTGLRQSPFSGLFQLIVWITETGSGLKSRLSQLLDSSNFRDSTPSQSGQPNNLMHLLALSFKWTNQDPRLAFMVKMALAILESQCIYSQVAIAFYESYLKVPVQFRKTMETDEFCGGIWETFVDSLRRRWHIYRQLSPNHEAIGETVYVCDNPNHFRRTLEAEMDAPHLAPQGSSRGSRACLCRYFVYCSKACQAEDWSSRHRFERVACGSLHDELKRDRRWISASVRQQVLAYVSDFASNEISAAILLPKQTDYLYHGEVDEISEYMESNDPLKNPDTTRKWAGIVYPGRLGKVRQEHFPNSDLRDLVLTIKLDCKSIGPDAALESASAFRKSVEKSKLIADWMKSRVQYILDQCSELNNLHGNSNEYYVVLNVDAALGTDMIHFLCLAEVRGGSRPLPCKEGENYGELYFTVLHGFFFPSLAKSILAELNTKLNTARCG